MDPSWEDISPQERRVGLTGIGLSLPTPGSTFDPWACLYYTPRPVPCHCTFETERIKWTLFPTHPHVANTKWMPSAPSLLVKGT